MSRWLAEKASEVLASRSSRRGFLFRSALVSTAIASNPVEMIARPVSAYAAVCQCRSQPCSCGTACCDGYTEFCCNITGSNSCPSGTILGGWWKADGSGFCGDAPRYYMDCNVLPGSEAVCYCHCSGDDCNHRVECCSGFRYGQCHQEYASLGRIYCRVVSCTPPWVLDPACTTSSATDQATASHTAPCLTGNRAVGHLDVLAYVPGGVRVIGWAADRDTPNPIYVDVYVGGSFGARLVADQPRPDVQQAFGLPSNAHGFDAVIPTTATGALSVCAYAINFGEPDSNPSIGCSTVTLGTPFGALDTVDFAPGGLRFRGWAVDPDTASPITVQIYANGTYVGQTTADRPRPDIAAYLPGFGANHGYDVTLAVPPGQLNVCAYAMNVGTPDYNPPIGCRSVSATAPVGNLESVTTRPGGLHVSGWAFDPDSPGAITVQITADGVVLGELTADQPRPDVQQVYGLVSAAHGFAGTVPFAGNNGPKVICAKAVNQVSNDADRVIGCGGVTVGLPFGNFESAVPVPGGVRVSGWVIDPDTANSTSVHVYVDYVLALIAPAANDRPDVSAAYPGYNAAHGFDVVVPVAKAGPVDVCVFAINISPGGTHPVLGCTHVLR